LCSVSQIFISFKKVSLFWYYEHALQFLSCSVLSFLLLLSVSFSVHFVMNE
jgi:hypothetical protein